MAVEAARRIQPAETQPQILAQAAAVARTVPQQELSTVARVVRASS